MSEADPDLVDGDAATVSIDVEVGGDCLTRAFGFYLFYPHGFHQGADCVLYLASLILWDCVNEGGDVVFYHWAVPDPLHDGEYPVTGVGRDAA